MSHLILVRHGQSEWNLENRFTGWVDVDLAPKGKLEACKAGELIKELNLEINHFFSSYQKRAIETLKLMLVTMRIKNDKIIKAWELNERHYGSLQGLDKDETRQKFGAEQVHIWRRSFDIPPPDGESLEMCAKRTLPYLNEEIEPDLQSGKNVLVAAHGNSLRSIVMSIENLSPNEILSVEIPTGVPIHYQYENGKYSRIN